jgi:hypothetical protein
MFVFIVEIIDHLNRHTTLHLRMRLFKMKNINLTHDSHHNHGNQSERRVLRRANQQLL